MTERLMIKSPIVETKRLITLLLLIAFCLPSKAQWKLIYKSQDVMTIVKGQSLSDTINPITSIEARGKLSKKLIIRHAHSKRELINTSTIWGFTDNTNTIWRCYNGDLCRLINYNGSWAEYGIYRTYVRLRASKPEVYYEPGYSRTLDGKVEITWQKAMEDIPSGLIFQRGKK